MSPEESMRTAVDERSNGLVTAAVQLKEWVLIDGNRLFLATGLSLFGFLSLLILESGGFISFVNDDSMTRLAGGMIAGTFSLVTLVVSINQLILSREFSTAGEVRETLEGVYTFRDDLATHASIRPSPGSPTQLLQELTDTLDEHVATLEEAAETHQDQQLHEFVSVLDERLDRTEALLDSSSFGTFGAISVAIDFDAARFLYLTRALLTRHGDSGEASEALEQVEEGLELFIVAREHFKTTYLQRELTRFSQLTLLTGIPAVSAALLIGLIYAGPTGAVPSHTVLPWLVSGLIAVVGYPLTLLTAYIIRTATVTRRTVSVGPMLPQKDPDADPFETLEEPTTGD